MKRRTLRRIGAAAMAPLMMAALVGQTGCTGIQEQREATTATEPQTETVVRRTIEVTSEASGLIEPIRVVEVKSKASGEVLSLHVQTGDRVEQGALLADIDPRDVRNGLAQAEADLEVAQVKARTTEANRARAERLRAEQVMTQQEYEAAVESAAGAKAALVRASTNLELARERMRDVTIRAPIAGVILEKNIEQGQIVASATTNVSGGTTLLRMADLAEVQARALVDEVDIGRVVVDQRASVTVESYPGRVFRGRVAKIEPAAVVVQNVTMFPVLVRLDNRESLLRPGMNAEVVVEVARRPDVVAVANTAVVARRDVRRLAESLGLEAERDGTGRERGRRPDRAAAEAAGDEGEQRAVVVVAAPGGMQLRRVTLGVADWDYTEVVSGLEPGEKVVNASVLLVKATQKEQSARMQQRVGGMIPGTRGAAGGGR
ncbi:MAG: efflux RND transporter periplasmic adaptor subunit [Candidatus Schekmanbacteria bacterium]|nr:efflux RND transporter periplasmic adaptor subunit [Candidatus Schekmanbacteria bacterium]